MNLEKTVGLCKEWHRRRQDFLGAEGNLKRQMKSILRRIIAQHRKLDLSVPADRAVAARHLDPLFKILSGVKVTDKTDPDGLVSELLIHLGQMQVGPMFDALEIIQRPLTEATESLEKLAKTLPAFEWIDTIKGMRELGLGQIVGEAGDLNRFDKKSQLWKRMGVAVFDGNRQRKTKNKELAELYGYSPKRRAILFNLGDSMIRAQGTYVPVYYREKDRQCALHPDLLAEKGGKGHMHNRARRYMEKMMLRDLWQVWRGSKPIDYVPHGAAWPTLVVVARKALPRATGQAVSE